MDDQTTTPVADNADLTSTVAVAALVAAPLLLAGCGGGGGGSGDAGAESPPGPALEIDGLDVLVTTDTAASVLVDALAATDGRTSFSLDGTARSASRPRDPGRHGAEAIYEFAISATGAAGSAVGACHVVINPAIEDALPAADERVLRTRHLLHRIAFAAGEDDLGRFLNVPYATVVQRLVDEARYEETTQDPPAAATFQVLTWSEYSALSNADKQAYDESKSQAIQGIYAWWWREIMRSRHPLLERMAIFWHNLLVVAAGDVFEPLVLWRYLDLIRRHALGSYRDLLHGIAHDASMSMFLDSNSNVKGRPNENFARELLELFTLGEGHVYGEQDVVEVAKCFTGWGVTDRQEPILRQNRHEPGAKTVLGQVVSFPNDDPEQVRKDGEAVLEIVLAENRTAVFLCEKLWHEFIGAAPDAGIIASWAGIFRGTGDYDIRRVLRTIFTSAPFTAAGERGNMIRSPVEYAAAVFRAIGREPANPLGYHWRAAQEDQELLNPPNVRGWVGGLQWISAKSLLERRTHMSWTGWEFYNSGTQLVPARLFGALEILWFAVPVVQRDYVDAATTVTWDPHGERIRRLLLDPALNCK